ncbi:MAG TPA: hypothetical protein VGE18_03075 [Candidatus Paceibacterota bacterium]
MKKTLLTNLKYIAFGLTLAFAASTLAQWTAPASIPYGSNTGIPIHVGPAQIKTGGLSVNNFIVSQNASFEQDLSLRGTVRGGTPLDTTSTLQLGSVPMSTVTDAAISGNLAAADYIQNQFVANPDNSRLCADGSGVIGLCTDDLCSNISGHQYTIPQGHTRSSDGTCNAPTLKRFYSVAPSYKRQDFTFPTLRQWVEIDGPSPNHAWTQKFVTVPYIGKIGIDNSRPEGVIIDTLPGISKTEFALDKGRLLTVQEAGTYSIKISARGSMGLKNRYNSAIAFGNTNFFVKINNDHYPLAPVGSGFYDIWNNQPGEDVPVDNYFYAQYSLSQVNKWKSFGDVPYNFSFEKTIVLQPGDTVDLYAYLYGMSWRGGLFGGIKANFDYYIDRSATIIDITLNP